MHEWTFKAIDPDGDNVSYQINWGDGTYDDWFGWYASEEEIIRTHNYPKFGMVTITARAKDIHNATGEWKGMNVIIPKITYQLIIPLLLQLLKRLFR
jgi:hypothetical protein